VASRVRSSGATKIPFGEAGGRRHSGFFSWVIDATLAEIPASLRDLDRMKGDRTKPLRGRSGAEPGGP